MNILEKNRSPRKKRSLVLFELNEVPWKIIDWYVGRRPRSAFASLLKSSATYTTVTRDEGELHPWTTWPSLHRGVYNTSHNIRFINQDLTGADAYPPVWQTLKDMGKSVGVFGSLQSYSGLQPGYSFYVPDTFSPGCETLPAEYSAFQRFNLRQTQQDGAEASSIKVNTSVAADVFNMLQTGLSFKVCGTIATHIANERINPLYRSRRSVLQGLVAFDIFKHALNESRPDFCTFFTNHVAGMMHRYWRATFPEDFKSVSTDSSDWFHANSIRYAMDIADMQLRYLMRYTDSTEGMLMLASSMGQEAIDRGQYLGEWRIKDVQKFLDSIEWKMPVRNMMAMQPDFAFAFDSETDAKSFLTLVAGLVDNHNIPVFQRAHQIGPTVNLGLSPSKEAMSAHEVKFSANGKSERKMKIENLGIQFLNRDPGTGYHQPRGVLFLYGDGIEHDDARSDIELTEIRPAILELMAVSH
jgi:hypothetical protein